MRATVGDLLAVPGQECRIGLILRVLGQDGAPPYVVKWRSDGHIAMVTPGPYARIVQQPGGTPAGMPASGAG
jgi:hypothetical protein